MLPNASVAPRMLRIAAMAVPVAVNTRTAVAPGKIYSHEVLLSCWPLPQRSHPDLFMSLCRERYGVEHVKQLGTFRHPYDTQSDVRLYCKDVHTRADRNGRSIKCTQCMTCHWCRWVWLPNGTAVCACTPLGLDVLCCAGGSNRICVG